MPNRILREGILQSERINALSSEEELFYRRLISVVDDYGRYYAKPELLRSACYPLKIDQVTNNDVAKRLLACAKHMLVKCYQVDNKDYLEILDFKQQVRAKQSKFPCVADAKHMISNDHLDVVVDVDVRGGKTPIQKIWDEGLKFKGVTRTLLGKLCKEYSEEDLLRAILTTRDHDAADPKTYLMGVLKNEAHDPTAGAI